jgi:hypothetical protein
MRAMAKLRPHVDAFFDKVTVNVADRPDKEKLRESRLKLLNEIRDATCPSRKSCPRVFMMQAGQDWRGDDGPGSLDGSS